MIKTILKFLIALTLIFIQTSVFSQGFEKVYQNYTIDDGLPSNETYYSLEDDNGYLWIATDQGVAKFNGLEFIVYDKDDGLEDVVVFKIYKDQKGRLWFATMSGKLFYFQNDKFFPYQYNDLIVSTFASKALVLKFSVENNKLWMQSTKSIFTIDFQGKLEKFGLDDPSLYRYAIVSVLDESKRVITFLDDADYSESGVPNVIWDADKLESFTIPPKTITVGVPFSRSCDVSNKLYFSVLKNVYFYDGNAVQHLFEFTSLVRDICIYKNNSILIMLSSGESFVYNYVTGVKEELKDISSISSVTKFDSSIFCYTTLNNGIYIESSVMPENFIPLKNQGVTTCKMFKNQLYLFVKDKNDKMVRLDHDMRGVEKVFDLKTSMRPYWMKVIDSDLFVSQEFAFKINENGVTFININRSLGNCVEKMTDGRFIHGGVSSNFVSDLDENVERIPNDVEGRIKALLRLSKDTILIGMDTGLSKFNENDFNFAPFLSGIDVMSLERFNAETILVGTKTNGLKLLRKGVITDIDNSRLEKLKVKQIIVDNGIYFSTNNGVYIYNENFEFVMALNRFNGLSSNIINSIEIFSEYLIVGTDKGLDRFHMNWKELSEKPKIWFKNDQEQKQTKNLTLVENDTIRSLEFENVSWGKLDHNGIQCSVNNSEWRSINGNNFSFENYKVGIYEVRFIANNSFGRSSNILTLNLTVKPVFYKRLWFLILMGSILILTVLIFARWRINKIQNISEEQKVTERRISDLKDQALRSKLNPHFMFNALNSIQRLYVDDNQELANDYLADFSILLRKILDLSEQKFITIEEETETLNLYLELESLRTNKSFNYSILIDDEVDVDQKNFPSLLLQPIVENAIWHGILPMPSANFEGEINIRFQQKEHVLVCTISDNGVGYQKSLQNRKKLHEPKGVIMTRERLEGFGEIEINELSPNGTIVTIKISLDDTNSMG